MKWQAMRSAPKDGTEVLILFEVATVEIVRLCWWDDGNWWSYRNPVTQETIEYQAVGWIEMPEVDHGAVCE